MTPERWQRIENLYHSALGRAPGERAAYLAAECGGDEELRREVESLISNGQEGGAFLERPALEVAAEQYVSAVAADLTGRKLGRYEIVSRLGAGGMGEVYRARDTRLKREVALKVLPREWMADAERKRRFELEARAASALNHPNIVTIFDIDQVDGVSFIAMEFVPGKTLDQMIPRRGMRLQEALKYAVEIAGALAAAHGAGIVHRDLKPGNVMVTGDGRVKILDFGLAKLAERPAVEGASTQTETGAIMGTAAYMSPEQAQGKPVDARSDIFSFGSVLYEMVTGRRAFHGDTNMSTLAAIIDQETAPLKAGVPQELERIITRCLRKDPARRFQHMDDVRVALQEVKEESESSLPARTPTAGRTARRRWVWAAAAAGAVTLAGAVWWLRGARKQPSPWEVVPLTSLAGRVCYPSFSPDGNQVAFSWGGEKRDNYDIYVMLIGSPTPARLTTDAADDLSPAFSPDGRSIGFVRFLEKRAVFVLIPAIGGTERIVADVFGPYGGNIALWLRQNELEGPLFAWLPDGKHVVTAGLALLSIETGESHSLTSSPPNGAPDYSPAVSPDGRTVAFARSSGYAMSELYLLDLRTDLRPKGDPRRLTSLKRASHSSLWTPDGRQIIFTCGPGFAQGLWKVAVSGSTEPEQLHLHDIWGHSALSRTGNRLVYSRAIGGEQIWRLALSDSGQSLGPPAKLMRLAPSNFFEDHLQHSPDGKRIAFESDRGGNQGIWICDADGSNIAELYSQAGLLAGTPRWAPDRERLAFDSNSAGNMDIYVIRASGGKPVQLTADPADDQIPSWSADGKWVYFTSKRSGQSQIWKVPAGGGRAVQVTRKGGWVVFESRDGRFIYYTKSDAPSTGLWRMPVSGGEENLVIPSIAERNFEVVKDGIYFEAPPAADGQFSIRFLTFTTGKVRTILLLRKFANGFSVAPDRQSLLYAQLSDDFGANLMLVENFRP